VGLRAREPRCTVLLSLPSVALSSGKCMVVARSWISLRLSTVGSMTRGNPRDIDRIRAQNRLKEASKAAHSRIKAKEDDAKIMREKQQAAESKRAAEAAAAAKKAPTAPAAAAYASGNAKPSSPKK